MVKTLEKLMAEQLPDFAQAQRQYTDAMAVLEKELGTAAVKTEAEAIAGQMGAMLLFCGALGWKANLDHFLDPVSKNFLDADPGTYLREPMARSLPEYRKAAAIRARFSASLSPKQREIYEDVADYVAYLETAGPKLTHYYGYMLGNEFLPRIVPGYYPDTAQTLAYRASLRNYFDPVAAGLLSQFDLL